MRKLSGDILEILLTKNVGASIRMLHNFTGEMSYLAVKYGNR